MMFFRSIALTLCCTLMFGCAGVSTAVNKSQLAVENKMSDSIFLDPVAPEERTIFVQVKNTSDNSQFNIEPQVVQALRSRGYIVVNDPKKANYMLQANVLSVGQSNKQSQQEVVEQGYAGALTGGIMGAGIGALAGGHSSAMIAGGLAGATLGTIVNSSVRDTTYSVVTDVQVSQRGKAQIAEKTSTSLKQGSSSTTTSNYTKTTDWERYQTRVVSSANKANLKLEEAAPTLAEGVALALAGIF